MSRRKFFCHMVGYVLMIVITVLVLSIFMPPKIELNVQDCPVDLEIVLNQTDYLYDIDMILLIGVLLFVAIGLEMKSCITKYLSTRGFESKYY